MNVINKYEVVVGFFHMFWMCSLRLNFSSRCTPRNLIFEVQWIFVFPILMLSKVFFLRLFLVPKMMNSVLASFILRWFSSIQVLIFPMSFSIFCFMLLLSGLKEWITAWSSHIQIRRCHCFLGWFLSVYLHSNWTEQVPICYPVALRSLFQLF